MNLSRSTEPNQAKCATYVTLRNIARAMLPQIVMNWLRQLRGQGRLSPPVGRVRFGSFRRLTPIGPHFGYERGHCIDRYYIERFLHKYAADICGKVLEVGDSRYTCQYGGTRVTCSDVLHAAPGNPQATIIADLTQADHIPSDTFDCIILTQTLMFIFDVRAAVHTLRRILKPGGVLLVTVAGISQIPRYDMDHWGDFWRFTTLSARRLFEEVFPRENVGIEVHGNVLVAMAFLHGLALEELQAKELECRDPDYELLITVRAVKPQ